MIYIHSLFGQLKWLWKADRTCSAKSGGHRSTLFYWKLWEVCKSTSWGEARLYYSGLWGGRLRQDALADSYRRWFTWKACWPAKYSTWCFVASLKFIFWGYWTFQSIRPTNCGLLYMTSQWSWKGFALYPKLTIEVMVKLHVQSIVPFDGLVIAWHSWKLPHQSIAGTSKIALKVQSLSRTSTNKKAVQSSFIPSS